MAEQRALRPMRFTVTEFAGGAGDLGLLVPLAIALITINGLSATAVFGVAGLAYVATALVFRVPVPVQPLKAFAAAAIALQLSAEVIAAGALLMSAAMAVLAATGLAGWLAERFPLILIRGIQASVALLLAKAAWTLAEQGNWNGLPSVDPAVSVSLAAGCCLLLLVLLRAPRVPGVLLVLAVGVISGLIAGSAPEQLTLGPAPLEASLPDGDALWLALTSLVIAQLPLTFGNSVVATVDAEREYFGNAARRVTEDRMAWSIAGSNLVSGIFHGLPICHGAGGVTAHYKLGARTAGATLMVGTVLLALAVVFGDTLPALLRVILPGALAGMLLYVAIEHGRLAVQVPDRAALAIVIATGATTLALGNLAWGVLVGAVLLIGRRLWWSPAQPETA